LPRLISPGQWARRGAESDRFPSCRSRTFESSWDGLGRTGNSRSATLRCVLDLIGLTGFDQHQLLLERQRAIDRPPWPPAATGPLPCSRTDYKLQVPRTVPNKEETSLLPPPAHGKVADVRRRQARGSDGTVHPDGPAGSITGCWICASGTSLRSCRLGVAA
jgi:hypothetical protein